MRLAELACTPAVEADQLVLERIADRIGADFVVQAAGKPGFDSNGVFTDARFPSLTSGSRGAQGRRDSPSARDQLIGRYKTSENWVNAPRCSFTATQFSWRLVATTADFCLGGAPLPGGVVRSRVHYPIKATSGLVCVGWCLTHSPIGHSCGGALTSRASRYSGTAIRTLELFEAFRYCVSRKTRGHSCLLSCYLQ